MATLIGRFRAAFNSFSSPEKNFTNAFNEVFYSFLGNSYTTYDPKSTTYIEKGFLSNPVVYSCINQMAQKTKAVPYTIKTIEDKKSFNKYSIAKKSFLNNPSPQQLARKRIIELKAFYRTDKDFPLDNPNPNQTWTDIWALYKMFMATTGNCYLYMVRPEEGANKGVPKYIYVLPSHYVNIVLKNNYDLEGSDNPISHYKVIIGNQFVEFKEEDVIHIKYPNPQYNLNGSHLYGLSPLRSALINIQNMNEAELLNGKTMRNGGSFGFLHSKGQTPLTAEQAKELKERMVEMDKDPARLSKLAGVSAEIGFTRISLTSDELKIFDHLKWNQKQIANVLNWSDSLLNNDDGGKYDKQKEERKRVITDNIMPDLQLLADSLNKRFLPLFKGYENTIIEWDASEMEEMQQDIEKMVDWLNHALDRGVITREEYRMSLGYENSGNKDLEVYTTSQNITVLNDAIIPMEEFITPIDLDGQEQV